MNKLTTMLLATVFSCNFVQANELHKHTDGTYPCKHAQGFEVRFKGEDQYRKQLNRVEIGEEVPFPFTCLFKGKIAKTLKVIALKDRGETKSKIKVSGKKELHTRKSLGVSTSIEPVTFLCAAKEDNFTSLAEQRKCKVGTSHHEKLTKMYQDKLEKRQKLQKQHPNKYHN